MSDSERGIVEVGDEMRNHYDVRYMVTSVETGDLGLLVTGRTEEFEKVWAFFPYELVAAEEKEYDWHGWAYKGHATLPCGVVVGYVNFSGLRVPGPRPLVEYDAQFAKTIEAMKSELGEMQSRPTDIRLD